MNRKPLFLAMLASFIYIGCGLIAQASQQPVPQSDTYGEQLGTVTMPFDCNKEALPYAIRGLALLHHMTYEGARKQFIQATKLDPDSAVGYWGQAMTLIHPLWSDPPSEETFNKGKKLVAEARQRVGDSPKARAFVEAVGAYFDQGPNSDEKANLEAYEKGWKKAHEEFPDDIEAICFYALAHMATAEPGDKSYAKQKKAIAMLKPVLENNPDHPGAHHYTIHASDYPPLAAGALDVARNYGKIAPAVPHALHMPTHIFTRLGLWPDSITMNKRSADASGRVSLHYLHALDYLTYAYLQRGEDDKAMTTYNKLQSVEESLQPHVASAYAIAAIPARIALERQEWAEAAALEARIPRDFPWAPHPAMEAVTYFARALGAARSGDGTAARKALEKMEQLYAQAAKKSAYWAKQVEIQRLSAAAWLAYEEGRQQEGLKTMRRAAELEGTTEKHPITPGEVLPAQELYADMLLEAGQYKEAEQAYLSALKRSPNRFNSLYGAGLAAELAGDQKAAIKYYKQLVKITGETADRERLQKAKSFLEGK